MMTNFRPYVLILLVLIAGCDQHDERAKKLKDENALVEATWVDAHPAAGHVYHLKDPNSMDGVRSTHEKNIYYIPSDPDVSVAVAISTETDYSDGELLKTGLYKYEGNKTCEIEDAIEINGEVKMILRRVRCRSFVEITEPR